MLLAVVALLVLLLLPKSPLLGLFGMFAARSLEEEAPPGLDLFAMATEGGGAVGCAASWPVASAASVAELVFVGGLSAWFAEGDLFSVARGVSFSPDGRAGKDGRGLDASALVIEFVSLASSFPSCDGDGPSWASIKRDTSSSDGEAAAPADTS